MRSTPYITILILAIVLLTTSPCTASVHDLGTFGQTYPVSEPDALTQIRQAAARVDWTRVFSRKAQEDKIKHFKPDGVPKLPRAENDSTYLVDLTYTLPFDIKDRQGNVLYPRGYTINPLDYMHYPRTLVVIDGSDPLQVEWFRSSRYANSLKAMLLLTDGSYYDLEKKLNRPVFYLTGELAQRLKIEAVPCVVRQKGRYMEVRQIDVKKAKTAQK